MRILHSQILLVLFDGYNANHLTWVASRLGFKWGIYCDVNYYDNAGYWMKKKRTRFSHYEERGKLPFKGKRPSDSEIGRWIRAMGIVLNRHRVKCPESASKSSFWQI